MTQAQTLQDIYTQLADIKDGMCTNTGSNDVETWLVSNLSSLDNSFTPSQIALSNPENKEEVTKAQTEINELISAALVIAKDNRISDDDVVMGDAGNIIPIPKDSPIALLPKLLEALLLYKAPLKFVSSLIIDIVQEVLFEHIKRKLKEKTGKYTVISFITVSKVLSVPSAARHITFKFTNIPNYVSKRFELTDSSKSIVKGIAEVQPDLSKYTDTGLATVSIGQGLSGQPLIKNIFWRNDITLEFANQIISISDLEMSNLDTYAYIHLTENCTCEVGYLS